MRRQREKAHSGEVVGVMGRRVSMLIGGVSGVSEIIITGWRDGSVSKLLAV